MKEDPVCKMEVAEDEAVATDYDGETVYFCSEGCRDAFLNERSARKPRTAYDLIIVGGGPAGLTAAVYASTLRMNAFLIAGDLGGQAIDSTKIKNYMGYDFITGPELIDKFKYQLIHSHYIDHLMSEAEKIEPVEGGFHVTTAELRKYFARTLIIATGMTRRRLDVPGEEEFQRKGIFYGNIQDFSFVQGKDVAVIGGGNSALQIVENLHGTAARNIRLVTDVITADPANRESVSRFDNLRLFEGYKVIGFRGNESVGSVVVRKMGEKKSVEIPAGGVFISIGFKPASALAVPIVDINDRGEIVIGSDCSTSCPGVFAAGDVTNAFGKRIIIAAGEGAKAAMAAKGFVLKLCERKRAMDKDVLSRVDESMI